MASPTYDLNAATNTVAPNSSIFNRNASGIVVSSSPITTATVEYEIYTQFLQFGIIRQDIIIPNGSFTDPNVTTSAPDGTFAGTPTHNRILVAGYATANSQIIASGNYTGSSIRVPHTFVAIGAASGVSGNGMYSTGNGFVNTLQPCYVQSQTTSSSANFNKFSQFIFPIYLRTNRWSTNSVSDPINSIITEVAREIQLRYIPEFRLDLLFV